MIKIVHLRGGNLKGNINTAEIDGFFFFYLILFFSDLPVYKKIIIEL